MRLRKAHYLCTFGGVSYRSGTKNSICVIRPLFPAETLAIEENTIPLGATTGWEPDVYVPTYTQKMVEKLTNPSALTANERDSLQMAVHRNMSATVQCTLAKVGQGMLHCLSFLAYFLLLMHVMANVTCP